MIKPLLFTTTAIGLLIAPATIVFQPMTAHAQQATQEATPEAPCDPASQNCAPLENSDSSVGQEDNAAETAQREAQEAAEKAERDAAEAAEQARIDAEKAQLEAQEAAEKAEQDAAAEAEQAQKEAAKAESDAAEAAKQAEIDAAQDAEQAEREAADAAEQAEREAADAAEQAEREAAEAAQQAEREAAEAAQQAEGEAVKAEEKSERKTKKAETNAENETGETEQAEVEPPKPSPEAPIAEEIAEGTVEQQIEKAEEVAPAVVSEEISDDQKRKLKRAEAKRRDDARERRNELIGAAAAGAVVGALLPALGGRVVEDEGDRFVVERDGRYFVRRDESALFRHGAENVEIERLRNGVTRETVYRRNGSQIITVRDAGGYVLRRVKITPRGERYVIFDARDDEPLYRPGFERDLPPLRITMPREEYIVPGSRYTRRSLADIFAAPTVQELPQRYSLREVRESEQLRSFVRRVDLDSITFESGSAYVSPSQVDYLADIAGGMLDVIADDPGALFLVEGHTDAVGTDIYNLTLSDRRAETVARILAEAYGVPPENLIVEGYGEQFLKIDTQADERQNRRVTVRNISPLLNTASAD